MPLLVSPLSRLLLLAADQARADLLDGLHYGVGFAHLVMLLSSLVVFSGRVDSVLLEYSLPLQDA